MTILIALALVAAAQSQPVRAEAPVIERIGEIEIVTPGCTPVACHPIYTEPKVRAWLEILVGGPFDPDRAELLVERHYTMLGYRPRVEISLVDGVLGVRILEAAAAVAAIVMDPNLLAPFLPPGLVNGLRPIERPYVLSRAMRTKPGDLVSGERLARDEYDLALLGYDIVPVPASPVASPGSAHPDQPAPGEETDRSPRPAVGSAGPEEKGSEPSSTTYVVMRQPPRGKWRHSLETMTEQGGDLSGGRTRPVVDPLQRSWIDVNVDYSRRDLLTARLFYTRRHVFREFDMLELSPYVSQKIAGAIDYLSPYILPASITQWNLFARTRLYDEFTPDRVLGGTMVDGQRVGATETDENRIGAKLAVGLEPFLHWNGHSLKGSAYVNRYHVEFGEFAIPINTGMVQRGGPVPGGALNDINIVGASAEYAYEHLFEAPRFSYRFVPTVELATKTGGGDVAFRRAYGELDQHYTFSPGFEIDMRWKAGIMDREAPVFEQFTLGGEFSLRGFVRDDFIGTRMLSAQNDLWIPISFGRRDPGSGLGGRLLRNLKTSIIFDAGSVSFEDMLGVHFARGIGFGLLYTAESSPTVIRIDIAWGYWEGITRWYPYIWVSRKW